MKPRHSRTAEKTRQPLRSKNKSVQRTDQLGIQRGQNAEKGNTTNPRNIRARDAKQAAH